MPVCLDSPLALAFEIMNKITNNNRFSFVDSTNPLGELNENY
jgi:hypothetical protein